jgi:polyisoprenoid-binding protein YceI
MRKLLAVLSIVVALAVAGVVVAYFAIWSGDTPEEAALSTSGPVATGDIEFAGTWTVDNTSGEFDRANERYTRSYAGYRIDEELATVGANTAVGRTDDVTGTMTIEGTSITDVDVEVYMTTLESDQERRDGAIGRRGLETERFPTASFKLTEPIDVGEEPAPGEGITENATGDLTLHGVTKRVTVPIQAKWTGQRIEVVASFDVALADYGIEPPTIPGRVLSVDDTGTVEMALNFVKQS